MRMTAVLRGCLLEARDFFILDCKKSLIFRKEYKGYVVFDPIGLEFYIMNEIAAEIMYLLSEGLRYEQMFSHYADMYGIEEGDFKELLRDFFVASPFFILVYPNLIKNGVARNFGL